MPTSDRRPTADPPLTRRFWLFQIAGWLAFGAAMTFSRIGSFPLAFMVVSKGVLTVVGFVLSLGLRAIYRPVLAREPSLPRLIVLCVVLSYLAATVWAAADNLLDVPISRAFFGRTPRFSGPLALFNGSVYFAFALLAWSMLYIGVRHFDALQAARERSLRAESLAQRARLDALRFQLQPHFLFNTLNAISTLVVDGRASDASRMIARLSDFLRATLDGPEADEIPLADELSHARRYLEIEQVRFGERLSVAYELDADIGGALVPALVLQPLIENAVRHAVAPSERGATIRISAHRAGDRLALRIDDDGPGLRGNGSSGHGIGLANTRERLVQLYGDEHRLQLTDDGGVHVAIDLPYRAAPA